MDLSRLPTMPARLLLQNMPLPALHRHRDSGDGRGKLRSGAPCATAGIASRRTLPRPLLPVLRTSWPDREGEDGDPDRTSCACSSSGAIQWAGVVFPYPMNCASAPRRAARSREVVDIKRERDWRLCAGTPISTTEIGEGAFPINGGNHEDLEQAADSRAGSWPRGYELPSGRDRHHLTVSSNLLTL